MAPTLELSPPSVQEAQQHPREAALYYQLVEQGTTSPKDLEAFSATYGTGASAPQGPDVSFADLAKLLHREGERKEGKGNAIAYACHDNKAHMEPFRIPRRDVGANDVHIAITHCGICHTDVHMTRGEWGETLYPMVPGHEIVGFVTEVGDSVSKFKPGDRAGIGCFVDSCRKCSACEQMKEEQFCSKVVLTYGAKDDDGNTTYGGYSSHIVCNQDYVLRVPKNIPLAEAAPLLCAGITTWTPLVDLLGAKPGMKVGVVGLGGLGHMAVKLAKAMGCEVTIISTSEGKKEEAMKKLKADHFLVSKDEKAMKAAAETLDGIVDTVSAVHPMDSYLQLLKVDGKLMLVGVPPEKLNYTPAAIIMRRRTIVGSQIGGIKGTQDMLDFCGKHNISCEIEKIRIQDVNDALDRLARNEMPKGAYRFVIDVQGSLINNQ